MKIDEGKREYMIYNASAGGSVGADAMRDVLGALDEAMRMLADAEACCSRNSRAADEHKFCEAERACAVLDRQDLRKRAEDAEASARAVEAEIVAWLRNDDICKTPKGTFTVEFEDLADAIERGEHRAKK